MDIAADLCGQAMGGTLIPHAILRTKPNCPQRMRRNLKDCGNLYEFNWVKLTLSEWKVILTLNDLSLLFGNYVRMLSRIEANKHLS